MNGQELRRLRLAAGLTLRELARRAGISHALLSYVEAGKRAELGAKARGLVLSALSGGEGGSRKGD